MSLPTVDLPTYFLTRPSTKEKVMFRPFNVREEKNLLIAMQENSKDQMVHAIKKVISDCTFNKIDVGSLNQVDVEYMFIMIRNKSMGEGVDVEVECEKCEHKTPMQLDLSKIEVEYPKQEMPNVVQLSDTLWVTLRLPTLEMGFKMNSAAGYDEVMSVMAGCVVNIIQGDETYDCADQKNKEICDWLETLPREKFDKIDAFFGNIPKIVLNDSYVCAKCGAANTIRVEGLQSFFD